MQQLLKNIFVIFTLSHANAQSLYVGAEASAQANTLVADPIALSIYTNPAGMANLQNSSVLISYQQIFPVEGLQEAAIMATIVQKKYSFGFSADQFGDSYYHESKIGFALAKKQDKVSMGIKASYLNNGIFEMSSRKATLLEFGILVQLNKKLNAGLSVSNVSQVILYQRWPTLINFGFSYHASPQVKINVQTEYNLVNKPQLRFGLSYLPKSSLKLMCGVNPSVLTTNFGIGLVIKKYFFVYALSTNPNFGFTNNFSLQINLKHEK